MKDAQDAFGKQLLAQYENETRFAEIIEREDFLIDFGADSDLYFTEYGDWSPLEQQAVSLAKGRILDVGCGAGRHYLYLQEKGLIIGFWSSALGLRFFRST